ncbi:MAG: winged helix-turn-helix transcriptional regulator [Thermoplasmata archaeon]|nr:MAG: winged helix-turn-helix transcriptional regulator [Thermoplasmata archaeon]
MTGMFKAIFGNNPFAKILDFLGDHPDYDYNISDLSEYTEISRPTLYKIIPELVRKKLLIETRKVGKSKMYKLNTENEIVKVILKFDFELADIVAKMEEEEQSIFV